MRWLICLVVVVSSTGTAVAERLVVNDPPMVRRCPRAKTWDQVVSCLTKFGKVKVTKAFPRAKLVTLTMKQNYKDVEQGVLLYVERNGEWHVGGRYEAYGADYDLLGFEQVTIGKKSGYRIDIGQLSAFTLNVDGITFVPAQLRIKRQLFCNGVSYHCPEATTRCDVMVQGKAWYTFRGTLEYEDNAINIKGDRTRAGPHCAVAAKVYLGWP